MSRTVLLFFLFSFLGTSGGKSEGPILASTTFADVNGTRISIHKKPLLASIHDTYNSIVEMSKDFSRFPLDDTYRPDKVNIWDRLFKVNDAVN